MNELSLKKKKQTKTQTPGRLAIPRVLLVATLAATALGCPRPTTPAADAEAGSEVTDVVEAETPVVVADAPEAGMDATEPGAERACTPGPGPDGAIELAYGDGAVVAYGRFFADGASQIYSLDGGVVGSFNADPDGVLPMGGPCSRLA